MKSLFETTSEYVAAYLIVRGYRPMVRQHDRGVPVFMFPPEARLSAEAYYAGASVSAKDFVNAIDRLRESIQQEAA